MRAPITRVVSSLQSTRPGSPATGPSPPDPLSHPPPLPGRGGTFSRPTSSLEVFGAALLALFLLPALAGGLIFADGFESGDTSAWSETVGLPEAPACVAGPPVAGLFAGDLGPAPGGPFEEITCVEIHNDQPFERPGEVAFSGIPMPESLAARGEGQTAPRADLFRQLGVPGFRDTTSIPAIRRLDLTKNLSLWSAEHLPRGLPGLTTTDGLALIGPGHRLLAAQFDVLSRWGAPVGDAAAPIRWLAVSVAPNVPADGAAVYALRRYGSPPAAADPFAATVTPVGNDFVVDTGVATFTLDPANPALLASIAVALTDDGDGRETLYAHQPGAGPKMIFDPGGGAVTLDTTDPAAVTVDPGGFEIVEHGPMKVVAALRGHFSAPGGASRCTAVTPPYERFGYTAIFTFTRASRDLHLQLQFRNECSDAFNQDWMDDAVAVRQASWELPLTGLQGTATVYHAGAGSLAASASGFDGLTVVEQRKGGGTPWRRRSRVLRDGMTLESGEFFDRPLVALADDTFVAAAQMPWMRYREPQALAVDGKTLSLRPVSEELTVGEAKAVWSFARLTLTPTALAEGSLEGYLEALRDRGQASLERGLLLSAELDHLNSSALFGTLGTGAPSPIATYYADTLDFIHQQNVKPGGQWDIAKTFGSQLWPDVQFDFFFPDWGEPAANPVTTNYWNASGAELFEFLRTGDPKWAWDFALPQSWLQSFTAHLNIGDRSHGNRNGFSVAGTGVGEGHWHRDGNSSSDDYNYNYGLQLAYAVRPNAALRQRFGNAGRTVVERYDVPWEDQADRELFVNTVDLSRSAIQHFEHLANCAEFAPGSRGSDCQAKLLEILEELASDNLSAGVMCGEDLPGPNPCGTPQQFMLNAHFHHFFHRVHANYGDVDGLLRRALVEAPRAFYDWAIPKEEDGVTIDLDQDWPGGMDCDLTPDRTAVVSCAGWADGEPTYWENRPHTVSLLLLAHALDPSIGLCQVSRDALEALVDADALGGYVGEDVGWWKGAAQMVQGLVFAVGGAETCGP